MIMKKYIKVNPFLDSIYKIRRVMKLWMVIQIQRLFIRFWWNNTQNKTKAQQKNGKIKKKNSVPCFVKKWRKNKPLKKREKAKKKCQEHSGIELLGWDDDYDRIHTYFPLKHWKENKKFPNVIRF